MFNIGRLIVLFSILNSSLAVGMSCRDLSSGPNAGDGNRYIERQAVLVHHFKDAGDFEVHSVGRIDILVAQNESRQFAGTKDIITWDRITNAADYGIMPSKAQVAVHLISDSEPFYFLILYGEKINNRPVWEVNLIKGSQRMTSKGLLGAPEGAASALKVLVLPDGSFELELPDGRRTPIAIGEFTQTPIEPSQ